MREPGLGSSKLASSSSACRGKLRPPPLPSEIAGKVESDVENLPSSLEDAVVADAEQQTCAEFNVVHLKNLCDIRLIDRSAWPQFFDDMRVDIEQACRQYGEVLKVYIDEADTTAWVKYGDVDGALDCQTAMHGHHFAGHMVEAILHTNDEWPAADQQPS